MAEELNERLETANAEVHRLNKKVKELEVLLSYYRTESQRQKQDQWTQTTQEATPKPDWTQELPGVSDDQTPMSVADMVRQAAEQTTMEQAMPGYILQPETGLFYNQQTGYFYDSNHNLFYHPTTQEWYFYNTETAEFQAYSQQSISQGGGWSRKKYKRLARHYGVRPGALDPGAFETLMDVLEEVEGDQKKKKKRTFAQLMQSALNPDGQEEVEILQDVIDLTGEASSSSDESESILIDDSDSDEDSDVLRRRQLEKEQSLYPPCIRLMEFPGGRLHIVTIAGASVGRVGGHADIQLEDENISRSHVKIVYEAKGQKHRYFLEDLDSRNGTKINGEQLFDGRVRLRHGDRVELGSRRLLAHIHQGNNTCLRCEPGLADCQETADVECVGGVSRDVAVSRAQKERLRRLELKMMKKRYGLQNAAFEGAKSGAGAYRDRAAIRRKTQGSDHPSHLGPEAPSSSVHKAITSENKGFKMLAKMGWKEGSSLGASNSGITEPIAPAINLGKAGLGAGPETKVAMDNVGAAKKAERWLKTQQRYKNAIEPMELTEWNA